jgi:hypothetical protein
VFNNVFLDPTYVDTPTSFPERLYARLDQSETEWVFFDAVVADFMDTLLPIEGIPTWVQHSEKAPIFVLQTPSLSPFVNVQDLQRALEEDDDSTWFEIGLAEGRGSFLYHNLFRPGIEVAIASAARVTPSRATQLSSAFSLSGLSPASTAKIGTILANITGTIEWVGVYDVGQGNANGLCNSVATPLAYFDLGGGVNTHHNTFPAAHTDFCYSATPPVILSHWDWDHWSSGAKFAGAQSLPWIAPQQRLGAVHATFAAGLHRAGNLYIWPGTQTSLTHRQITIHQCTGGGAGRNHTGLAVEVAGPGKKAPILLTGDARYSAIPGATAKNYTSVVVPHHGANMKSRSVPTGRRLAGARAAYSFGTNNHFGHPDAQTHTDHHSNGWPHATHMATTPIDRETNALRATSGLGHLGLSWSATATLPNHSASCVSAGCAVGLKQL